MSTNYIQPGEVLDYTAGADIASGAVVVMDSLVGVALKAIANGATGPVKVRGVFELPKLSTDTINQGQVVYWDAGNSRITETASTHAVAGRAAAASGSGVTTCRVLLNV